jgi:L-aminopeptidase/D-esterase-like protein
MWVSGLGWPAAGQILLAALFLQRSLAAAAAPSTEAPVPHISFEGPALTFDFPDVEVGVAEYEEGPTGATVLYFPKRVKAAVDVRGGAPGTVNTDGLRLAYDSAFLHAIALSGGSAYGLSVATGVANAIKDATPNAATTHDIAVVSGAIIFDLGSRRYNTITPDDRLGRAAFANVRPGWFPLGARGAGRFATQGGFFGSPQHSGQGAAFRQIGKVKVLVVPVVNADGAIVNREGHVLRCQHPKDGDCGMVAQWMKEHLEYYEQRAAPAAADPKVSGMTSNTTITVVVTNQELPFYALQRLAVQVHNSMARAIQPFGTEVDGDTLFAVTTGEVADGALNHIDLGALASETAWDAILASAPTIPPVTPRSSTQASPDMLKKIVGRYEFAPGTLAQIRVRDSRLELEVSGSNSMYLKAGQPVALSAVAADEFELAGVRGDRLRVDRNKHGRVVGITLNPGPWPVAARRIP